MRSHGPLLPAAVVLTLMAMAALPLHSALLQVESRPPELTNPAKTRELVGRLVDQTGSPVVGILIELQSWSGEMLGSTVTGSDGIFRFEGVALGQYQLKGTLGANNFSESMSYNGSPVPIEVRLSESSTVRTKVVSNNPQAADRVSVNDLAAPTGARKKLKKAAEALQQNQLDKALQLTDEALKTDRHWARAWLLRGLIHQQSHDLTSARQDFQTATQADPGSGEALAALGGSYTLGRDWPKAEFYLQRATTVAPNLWQGWFELSRLELLQGKYAAAAGSARRALGTTPPAPAGCRYFLGTAEAALGHVAEAAKEFRLFLGSHPPPSRAASDAAYKLQLIEASGNAAAQPAAKQP